MDLARLAAAYQTAHDALLAERTPDGHWVGELSTSALSTAVAVSALSLVQRSKAPDRPCESLIANGLRWLAEHQNPDGGWGDTVKSISNISTGMLCPAAFHLAGAAGPYEACLRKAEDYLDRNCGKTRSERAEAIRNRYGKDRTFAVPILTTCALAGLSDWQEVEPLPFELACFPQSWFRFLRLHVVSYALPALIAMGQAIYRHRPPRNPLTRIMRRLAIEKSLRVLERIQPSSGGFLEAVPLTSFVTLSLASIGLSDHPVAKLAVQFLVNSVRSDGSWPIDSNLATWVTTLAVNALAAAEDLRQLDKRDELKNWLLRQQYQEWHPYTGAAPGGWAWTDLPGGVPDADDTPGAILALIHLDSDSSLVRSKDTRTLRRANEDSESLNRGGRFITSLQNRDGGWPTFCRGWGYLPFDRSGPDLTAHNMRALAALMRLRYGRQEEYWDDCEELFDDSLIYLELAQRHDGSWLPLWFGNQYAADDENPTYGTSRVLAAYRDLDRMNTAQAERGVAWLMQAQNQDGGWGGAVGVPSSIEETALAVEVLVDAGPLATESVNKGLAWLVQQVIAGGLANPTPIGFYFAKLWYFEKLYPIVFSVAALGRALRKLSAANGDRTSREILPQARSTPEGTT